jgi:hypothetical protein
MTYRPAGRPILGRPRRHALILAATLIVVAITPLRAADWTGFAARPAPGEGDRDSGRFELAVSAGSSITDAVELFNLTDAPATFDLYAADVVATADDGRAPADRDIAVTGPGLWVTLERARVELAAMSSTLVGFTVDVPDDTATGAYEAALLVEPITEDTEGTITSRTRVGLWVEIAVLEGSDAPPGPAAGVNLPWLPLAGLAVIGCFGVLLYVTRERWHRWFEERREERALLRDFRSRRRQRSAAAHGRRG